MPPYRWGMEATTKRCRKCSTERPLSGFYKHPAMADGHLNICKECAKAASKQNYEKAGGRPEYERRRFNDPERQVKLKQYRATSKANHPDKYKARNAVSNALRDGRLQRGACEVCGADKVQAHHDDYSKPLEVRWLCFKHHREGAHGQQQRAM